MTRVLAVDVGGTKTAMSLYEGETDLSSGVPDRLRGHPSPHEVSLSRHEVFESASFSGLLPILGEFLRGERVDAAGFGVAGPVTHGVCVPPSLPWRVDALELASICGTEHVVLLNDVEAAVLGLSVVPASERVWLQERPVDAQGVVSLVSLGLGFGRAFLVPARPRPHAFATEAGHASFAPRNVIERRLLEYMALRHDPVSIEHVLSGPGLRHLYDFIIETGLAAATAQLEIDRAEDPSAQIGHLGARDLDEASAAAVALFVDILGAELGNVALQTLPRGGLYLWGSVARKLRPAIENGDLLDAFVDKDRMRGVLESIPLALITEADLGLLGAREAARALLA